MYSVQMNKGGTGRGKDGKGSRAGRGRRRCRKGGERTDTREREREKGSQIQHNAHTPMCEVKMDCPMLHNTHTHTHTHQYRLTQQYRETPRFLVFLHYVCNIIYNVYYILYYIYIYIHTYNIICNIQYRQSQTLVTSLHFVWC